MNIQNCFRIDWFDPRAVQRALESLLQLQNSKASVLQDSAFFMVHLSHLYMTTGKTIALTRRTFVSKMMSLLANTLSRFVKLQMVGEKMSSYRLSRKAKQYKTDHINIDKKENKNQKKKKKKPTTETLMSELWECK